VREASQVLEQLGTGRQLGPAAGSIMEAVRHVPKSVVPMLDAALVLLALAPLALLIS
jgi:hypothetical protein